MGPKEFLVQIFVCQNRQVWVNRNFDVGVRFYYSISNWLIFGFYRQEVVNVKKEWAIMGKKCIREGDIQKEIVRKGQSRFVLLQGGRVGKSS